MHICFIGLGKLGLPCAEVIAQKGHDVTGYDVTTVSSKYVNVKTSVPEAVRGADIVFIAVPTPHDPQYDGKAPTSHLEPKDFDYSIAASALREVVCHTSSETIIVLISTVLPGTVRREFKEIIGSRKFVYNPYLIAMGTVAYDMVNPEMVIIGLENVSDIDTHGKVLVDFYKSIMENDPRYEVGTWEEAEAIKIFYNCYSADTEVLTDGGWKLFSDATNGDQVLSLNPDTMIPEWVTPDKWVSRDWNDEMIHFHSSKDDILVTPGHNMFIGKQTNYRKPENGKRWGYSWSLMPAEEVIKRSGFVFQRSSEWHNDSPEFIEIAGVEMPTDLYVQLMAWYLSEGCVSGGRVIISQDQFVNPDKYQMITELFQCILGFYPGKNSLCSGKTGVSLLWPELADVLLCYGKSFDKFVPENIKSLGKEHIRLFLDIYNLADGSAMHTCRFDGTRSYSDRAYKYYATSSDQMAADLGELIIKVGRFPSYRTTRSDLSNKECHIVYELIGKTSNFQKSSTAGLKYSKIDYNGKVYCAMLPKNHIFLTRRNGKCTWQGNTFISAKISLVNMIQDVSERIGNMNVDVVTNALANSTYRIMGKKYMTAGLGDGGACHPRDNIALRKMAEDLSLGYDLFYAIMDAREKQAKNMAALLVSFGNPVVIVGKSYKPGVPYSAGSVSILTGELIKEMGGQVFYHDTDGCDDLRDSGIFDYSRPATYLIAHSNFVTYDGEKNTDNGIVYATGSVIVDPWRSHADVDGCTVIHYGNTRGVIR